MRLCVGSGRPTGSFWAMVLCSYLAWKGVEWPGILALFSGLAGTVGGIKLGQTNMEKSAEKK